MAPTAMISTSRQEGALDAALDLVAEGGLARMTLADVARTAGMGRATLYRAFPGGRDELVDLLGRREVARFLAVVGEAFDRAPDLAGALADGLHAAATHLADHAAARFVLEHEPELTVPVLGFAQVDGLLLVVRRALAPRLVRHLDRPDQAGWAVEWLARAFLSSLVVAGPDFDLTDHGTCHRLVTRYMAPSLSASVPITTPA